ncbi:MAG: YceI family protein [Anaerolineaceae bacterium]|jgi:polyisoprenoid-binding protein YceI
MSWKIDPYHTQIQFTARHMMISKVRGQFEKFSGTVNLDENNPANTTVEMQVETASVNTREPRRDDHLRSTDFFNAEAYPYITFKSKQVKVIDDLHALLVGDLTIRGATHEVTLEVEFTGKAKSPYGQVNYGFTGSTRINRKDWGLIWNVALETGGWLVSDEIEITIEIELMQVPEPVVAA